MSDSQSEQHPTRWKLGDYIGTGFQVYIDHWQDWLPPILVAAAVLIGAYACCLLPLLFVHGPVVSGLFYCGIRAVRGGVVDVDALKRGWETAGRAMLAYLAIQFVVMLPMLLLAGCALGAILAIPSFALNAAGPGIAPPALEDRDTIELVPDPEMVDGDGFDDLDDTDEMDDLDDADGFNDVGNAGGFGNPGQNQPPDATIVVAIIVFYAVFLMGMLVFLFWTFWFTTRTMFVLPLIADQKLSVSEAFSLSWRETKVRFWELLILNLLARIIANIGFQLCYVGAIFSVPLYFTMIAAAYEDRFGSVSEVTEFVEPMQ